MNQLNKNIKKKKKIQKPRKCLKNENKKRSKINSKKIQKKMLEIKKKKQKMLKSMHKNNMMIKKMEECSILNDYDEDKKAKEDEDDLEMDFDVNKHYESYERFVLENTMKFLNSNRIKRMDDNKELYEHQRIGVEWMKNIHKRKHGYLRSGLNADYMGIGKTLQALEFINQIYKEFYEMEYDDSVSSVIFSLIVMPLSVLDQWREEIRKTCNYATHLIMLSDAKKINNNLNYFMKIIKDNNEKKGERRKNNLFKRIEEDELKQGRLGCKTKLRIITIITFDGFVNNINLFSVMGFLKGKDGDIKSVGSKHKSKSLETLNKEVKEKDEDGYKHKTLQTFILDEAHIARNVKTGWNKNVKLINSHSKMFLTASPYQNNVSELYGIVSMMTNLFKSQKEFVNEVNLSNSGKESKYSWFKRHMFIKRDSSILKSKLNVCISDTIVWINLNEKQREIYKNVLDESEMHIMTKLQDLTRVCNNEDTEHPKFDVLFKMLKYNIDRGIKSVVFSQTISVVEYVYNRLVAMGVKTGKIIGSVSRNKRTDILDSFNKQKKKPVFKSKNDELIDYVRRLKNEFERKHNQKITLYDDVNQNKGLDSKQKEMENMMVVVSTTKSNGVGVNIPAASRVFIISPDWNPKSDDQAIGRCIRLNQMHDVLIVRFVTVNTIEHLKMLKQLNKEINEGNILKNVGNDDDDSNNNTKHTKNNELKKNKFLFEQLESMKKKFKKDNDFIIDKKLVVEISNDKSSIPIDVKGCMGKKFEADENFLRKISSVFAINKNNSN